MNRLISIGAALIVAINAMAEGPHLRLDSAYVDLGVVVQDSVAQGVLGFRNTGDEPLQIVKIFSDCGCTVPSYSSYPVAPGESGEIKVKFRSSGRDPGMYRKWMRVKSNADNSRVTFTVKVKVIEKEVDKVKVESE